MTSENTQDDTAAAPATGASPGGAGPVRRAVVAWALYAGVRLLLIAAIAAVLTVVGLPLLVALLIAIVAALPLSLVLFRGLRARVAQETEAATAGRRERRAALRAQLRGEAPPAEREGGEG